MLRSFTFFAISLIASTPQSDPRAVPHVLELRLTASTEKTGVSPVSFTFTLTNISDHSVRVPPPGVACDGENGTFKLHVVFTPEEPQNTVTGYVCAVGMGDQPDILSRARSWPELAPAQSISRERKTSEEMIHLFPTNPLPGRYVFSATYTPPHFTDAETLKLQTAGIALPVEPLTSEKLTYVVPRSP
jgi:hypothetical protein